MKILISGAAGHMGREVAAQAGSAGIEVAGGVDVAGVQADFPIWADFTQAPAVDCIVDFSRPASLDGLLAYAVQNRIPAVLATTGYDEVQLAAIDEAAKVIPIFRSANMSVGIALLRALSRKAAQVLGDDFDVEIVEAHHNRKADAPSGTALMLYDAVKAGKKVLFEGAQGTLLDLDVGTYPYVTSSHPISGGVCVGTGIGPTLIDECIGVMKAYTTRVGKGPFPTELFDETGERIRNIGREFGTTTGRPRRCGWFDAVIGRFGVRTSGLTGIALNKLDTLTGLPVVKICTGYKKDGGITLDFPASLTELAKCEPVYEELPGWTEDITGVRCYEDLPQNVKNYVSRIEELCGCRVSMVGVGPGREQNIMRG